MADYKDIISGTINSIVGKVKEVAESGAVRDIYENGANRAKSYGRIAKLALELNGENEELKRVYTEIGRLYYDQGRPGGLLRAAVRAGRRDLRPHRRQGGRDKRPQGRRCRGDRL